MARGRGSSCFLLQKGGVMALVFYCRKGEGRKYSMTGEKIDEANSAVNQ